MSVVGQQQTSSEIVSDVRFGALSGPNRATFKIHDIHVCLRAETGPRSVARLMSGSSQELTFVPGQDLHRTNRKRLNFLGYHFGPEGLTLAKKTVENFVDRAIRLYEQEPGEACASSRFGLYVRRWVRWVQAGLTEGIRKFGVSMGPSQ